MSSPPEGAAADVAAACALIAALPDETDLADAVWQPALARLVKLYGVRVESEPELGPFPPGHCVTATEAMMAVTGILRAVNLQAFELGMWQSWSGRR